MAAEVPELDIFVDTKNYEDGLKDVLKHIKPEWNRDDIKFKVRFAAFCILRIQKGM
jgi:hypothetical protein